MAYHWNRNTTPILCMATGMVRTALAMSLTAPPSPFGAAAISASSSSSWGWSLGPARMAMMTVTRTLIVPSQKHTYIQYGSPLPPLPVMNFCRTKMARFASTEPRPA